MRSFSNNSIRANLQKREEKLDLAARGVLSEHRSTSIASRGEIIRMAFKNLRELETKYGLRGAGPTPFVSRPKFVLEQRIMDRAIEIFPGVRSTDRKFLEFLILLEKEINHTFGQPTLDDKGMAGPEAYAHDFSKMMSVPGFYPDTGGGMPVSNDAYRRHLGLPERNFSSEEGVLVQAFAFLLFGAFESVPVKIPGGSQSGIPRFSYGRWIKWLTFEHAVVNLDEVISLARAGDLPGLMSKFDIVFCYGQGQRTQSDAAGKKRYVVRKADAFKKDFKEYQVDNSVSIPGIPSSITGKFSAIRFRYVWGLNSTVNYILNTIGGSARSFYGNIFEFTFKHRGIDHMFGKLRKFFSIDDGDPIPLNDKDLVFLDITSFDKAFPKSYADAMLDVFNGSDMEDFIRRSVYCPFLIRSIDKSGDDSIFLSGDPLNYKDDKSYPGLLSGWAFVSDAGKWAAFEVFLIAVRAGCIPGSIEALVDFLEGKADIGCFNLGDDNVVFGNKAAMSLWREEFQRSRSWIFDYEPGSRFIGHIFHNDGRGNLDISNDPVSAITNIVTPERDWGSKFRKYPAHGIKAKFSQLKAPFAGEVLKVFKKVFEISFGYSFDFMLEEAIIKERAMIKESSASSDDVVATLLTADKVDVALANTIIAEATRDPSVLRWKWDDNDLLQAFGFRLSDLEGRPSVEYSNIVAEKAGYREINHQFEPLYKDHLGESKFWIHRNCPSNIEALLLERFIKSK